MRGPHAVFRCSREQQATTLTPCAVLMQLPENVNWHVCYFDASLMACITRVRLSTPVRSFAGEAGTWRTPSRRAKGETRMSLMPSAENSSSSSTAPGTIVSTRFACAGDAESTTEIPTCYITSTKRWWMYATEAGGHETPHQGGLRTAAALQGTGLWLHYDISRSRLRINWE